MAVEGRMIADLVRTIISVGNRCSSCATQWGVFSGNPLARSRSSSSNTD